MIAMTIREIADAVGGEILSAERVDDSTVISGFVDTDSRNIEPGDVFVAKPGEFTDGHLFAESAVENGAVLCLVEREVPEAAVPQIRVPDVVTALGDLARENISRARAQGSLTELAVTGSNGKTTTKNLLREIFEPLGETVAPRASFNNEVGGPVTFLRVNESTRYLVAEMGASAGGEIRRLVSMAKPDVGIVLMVGLAHAGEFGGIEQTARAKTEMVTDLDPDGFAVLNRDDPRVAAMAEHTRAQVIWFGRTEEADVRATDIRTSLSGTEFTLHLPDTDPLPIRFGVIGEHHVTNALAAAAAAHTQGVGADRIRTALESVTRAEQGRMEVLTAGPITIINDAYNASPDSMAAGLRTLAQIAGDEHRTVAVLGEMTELGDASRDEHERIGELAVRLGLDQLVVVGEGAKALHLGAVAQGSWDGESVHATDSDAAYDLLVRELRDGDIVLVKSSNASGLAKLAEQLGEHYA